MKRGQLRDNIQDLFNIDNDVIVKKMAKGIPVVEIYELMSSNLLDNEKRTQLYKMDMTAKDADYFWESYTGDYGYNYNKSNVVMQAFQKIRYDYMHETHRLKGVNLI